MLSRRSWIAASAAAVAAVATKAFGGQPTLIPGYAFRFDWIEQGMAADGGHAILDLGPLAARAGQLRKPRIAVQRRLMVRIDGPGPAARVSVALASEIEGCSLRLDGVLLSVVPRVLDPFHRVGTAVMHVIDLDVPPNVPPGPFMGNLQWLAEPA
jgi:hypothetical protein